MTLIPNQEEENKWRRLLEPEVHNRIKQAQIDILKKTQKAMNPMLRDMISRGQAVEIVQIMIDGLK
jgi:hypothetical protein